MKKFTAFIICLSLLLCVTSCGQSKNPSGKSIYERGLDIVAELVENANDTERTAMLLRSAQEENETYKKLLACDYSHVSNVYKLTVDPEAVGILEMAADEKEYELVKKMYNERVIINQLVARSGVQALALCSVLQSSRLFDTDELKEDTTYLYTFENAYPVAVTFFKGEDLAVSAQGSFVLSDEAAGSDEKALEEYFDGYMTVEKIDIK